MLDDEDIALGAQDRSGFRQHCRHLGRILVDLLRQLARGLGRLEVANALLAPLALADDLLGEDKDVAILEAQFGPRHRLGDLSGKIGAWFKERKATQGQNLHHLPISTEDHPALLRDGTSMSTPPLDKIVLLLIPDRALTTLSCLI